MKELFTGILNISISEGILIIVCTLVRLIFRRMPKFVRCLMWLLVAIRLAVPFSIESPFSLLPAREYVTVSSNDNVSTDEAGNAYSNNELTDKANAGIINKVETADTAENNNSVATEHTADTKNIDVMYVLSIVWL